MAGINYTTPSVPIASKQFNGGLNSTAGPLGLQDNESSDLQNIDFDKFGSILKRNGYVVLTTSTTLASGTSYGLHWYEYDNAGTITRETIRVTLTSGSNCWIERMDGLDGTWDNITQGMTVTNYQCQFTNFLNKTHITNANDKPFMYNGVTTTTTLMTVPTGLTKAQFNEEFNNYLFLANCTVSSTAHNSRIYWYNIKSDSVITDTDFIEVAKDDGTVITGLKKLGDRLVIFKERSIYNALFTGDADIPFILPGGGRSNSAVGCIAPYSIQEVENGLVFLSFDGLYYYDGLNSYKISDRITSTFTDMNELKFTSAVSLVHKTKNRYWLSLPFGSGSTNDRVIVWDYFNNAFSVYKGINAASMAIFYVSGVDERPYFADYSGYVYRADNGSDDYPLNVQTAIDAYYWTNWRSYDDLVDQKGIPHTYIYYTTNNTVLTFSYSYDFESSAQYTQTFSLATSSDTYGVGLYGTATYASAGGSSARRDLTGRGRVVRFKFANAVLTETFRIDGFGQLPHLETNK